MNLQGKRAKKRRNSSQSKDLRGIPQNMGENGTIKITLGRKVSMAD